jgi:AcrR family transcriptional regulator
MDDAPIDLALITAAFALAARSGWDSVSVAAAATEAGIPLEKARSRFAGRDAVLLRFGRLADAAALTSITTDGTPRDRLFDILMRRFDYMQPHRDGIRAVMRTLPGHPALTLMLGAATNSSMAWMLEAAGLSSTGLAGMLRAKGLTAVWIYTARAWEKDDTLDLSHTMAALDRALTRAERFGAWLEGGHSASGPKPFPEDPAAEGPSSDALPA